MILIFINKKRPQEFKKQEEKFRGPHLEKEG
jgi:hypothetical protein